LTINEKDYNKEMLTQLEMLYNLPNIPQMLSRRDKDALRWAVQLGDWYIKNRERICYLP
jgi:hypothetical protein